MAEILIIDDDAQIRQLVRMALEGAGHNVVEASNGQDGLNRLSLSPPDVVMVDIVMPGLDGIETIRRLRADIPNLRIVALSGGGTYGFTDYLKYARMLGADEAIAKPVSLKDLVARVASLLEREGGTGSA